MVVGSRVLERLEKVGLSQAELARRIGVSQPTISNVIHRSKKGTTHLHQIARELGTTTAYLSGETDDPSATAGPLPEFSFDERQLVRCFSALEPTQRSALLTVALSMAGMHGNDRVRA